jgi:maltooligosyltrehalose trehalohydrolase
LSQLVSPGRLKIGAAIVFTSPFVPMVFQGEEWGASTPFRFFADHGDTELREAVRKGRCEEFSAFGWKPEDVPDPYAMETFERSRLNWAEMDREPHHSVLEWYRALIRMRRSMPVLTDGHLDRVVAAFDEGARWITIERGPITVVCNLADTAQTIALRREPDRSILLASDGHADLDDSRVRLPGESVAIRGSQRGQHVPY